MKPRHKWCSVGAYMLVADGKLVIRPVSKCAHCGLMSAIPSDSRLPGYYWIGSDGVPHKEGKAYPMPVCVERGKKP